jgi:hypothetical protein
VAGRAEQAPELPEEGDDQQQGEQVDGQAQEQLAGWASRMVTVTGMSLVGLTSAGSEVRCSGVTKRSRVMVWPPRSAPTVAVTVGTTPPRGQKHVLGKGSAGYSR